MFKKLVFYGLYGITGIVKYIFYPLGMPYLFMAIFHEQMGSGEKLANWKMGR